MGTDGDGVDWAALTHADGPARDIPALLGAMESRDPDVRESALQALNHSLCRWGDVYPATAPAVPHLARLALEGPGHREELLRLLGDIADGIGEPEVLGPARRAVAVALPSLLPLAHDADPAVRDAMVFLIAACGTPYALPLLPLLRARLAAETDPEVRAGVVTALALLDAGDGGWRDALLADPEPRVRLAAAEDLLRTAEPPLPHDVAEHCARAYAADPRPGARGWWPRPHVPFTDRLRDDPEAALRALAVGVPLTAEGAAHRPDPDEDESPWVTLAHAITDTWRDREADVLPWALRAMTGEDWELNWLAQMTCALPPRYHPVVRDHVHPHLASGLPDVRAAAVTALARAHAPEAVEEAVRLVEELPDRYVTVRAVEAVADVFGAGALPAVRAVVRRLEAAHSELVKVLARFPEVAGEVVEELCAMLTRHGTGYPPVAVEVLGHLGPAAGDAAERALRVCVTEERHPEVSAVATVAHYRVCGDPGLALSHLRRVMTARPGYRLELAGELGPAGAPLLPHVEPYLAPTDGLGLRPRAADAVWRITGRTEDTVTPVALRALAWERPYLSMRHPVETLTEMGLVPRFAVAPLRDAAESPRRLDQDRMYGDSLHPDYVVRDAVRRLLATAEVVD
jgi:HEAT repeat protein